MKTSRLLLLLLALFSTTVSISAPAQVTDLCDRTLTMQTAVIQYFTDVGNLPAAHLNCIDLDISYPTVTDLDFSGLSLANGDLRAPDFVGFTSLTQLNYTNNNLSAIPSGVFDGATGLTELILDNNSFATFPATACSANYSLTTISITNNSLSSISDSNLDNCGGLATLDISSNSLSALPAGLIEALPSLTTFDAEDNVFSALPNNFFKSSHLLTSIRLASDTFTGIPITLNLADTNLGADQQTTLTLSIPAGMPIDTVLSATGTSASISPNPYTIAKGEDTTQTITISSAAPFETPVVTLSPAQVPATQCDGVDCYTGFSFDNFVLNTLVADAVALPSVSVCDRSDAIKNAILTALNLNATDCANATAADLGTITELSASNQNVTAVQIGDLNDLPLLTLLNLSKNSITTIPDQFFANASALVTVDLSTNNLQPTVGMMDGLTATVIFLGFNNIGTLPKDLFKDHTNFTGITLFSIANNPITSSTDDDKFIITTANIGPYPGVPNFYRASVDYRLPFDIKLNIDTVNAEIASTNPGSSDLQPLAIIDANGTYLESSMVLNKPAFGEYSISLADGFYTWTAASIQVKIEGSTLTEGSLVPNNSICDRTASIRDAILSELGNSAVCNNVTTADILTVTQLTVNNDNDLTTLLGTDFIGLTNVTSLNLANNSITDLPTDIMNLIGSLTFLDMSGNALSAVPTNLCSSNSDLQNLQLGSNAISSLSTDLLTCNNLATLAINDNQISTLPTTMISNLTALTSLNVENNQITSIPDGFFPSTHNLDTVLLDGNSDGTTNLTFVIDIDVAEELLGADAMTSFTLSIPSGLPFDQSVNLASATAGFSQGSIDISSVELDSASGYSKDVTLTSTNSSVNPSFNVTAGATPAGSCSQAPCYSGFTFATASAAAFVQPSLAVASLTFNFESSQTVNETMPLASPTAGKSPFTYALDFTNSDVSIYFSLDVNATTGQLTGFAYEGKGSSISLEYKVTDDLGQSYTIPLTFNVNENPPILNSIDDLTKIVADSPYNITMPTTSSISSGVSPIVYTLTINGSNTLPDGLTFAGTTREFSGTPTQAYTGVLNYTATDALNRSTSQTFTMTIDEDVQPEFGAQATIADIETKTGFSIGNLVLPEATNGNYELTYTLTQSNGSELPAGLSFNATTRTFSGSTELGDVYNLTYVVSDFDGDTINLDFEVNIIPNLTPEFTIQAYSFQTPLDTSAQFDLDAATSGNGPIVYTISGDLPSGLTFDADTLIIDGSTNATGTHQITLIATDEDGDSGTTSITIKILGPNPVFDSIETIRSIANEQLDVTLPTVNSGTGTNPITYSLTGLPTGVNFDTATRKVTGTSTSSVDTTLNYTAMDADNRAVSTLIALVIVADNQPEFSANANIANIDIVTSVPLSSIVLPEATGGNEQIDYSLEITAGNSLSLATVGLTFDAQTRTFGGTPVLAGTYTIKYTAADIDGDAVDLTFTLNAEQNTTPELTAAVADIEVINGESISVTLPDANDGNNGLTYTLTLDDGTAIPSSLTFDAASKLLTGSFASEQVISLLYTVTDGEGDTDTESFTITVVADLQPSFSATVSNIISTANSAITAVTLPEATSGNPIVSYTLTLNNGNALPDGLSFAASTRILSGTPTLAGTFTLLYTATDIDGDISTLNFDIAIGGDAQPVFDQAQDAVTVVANEQLSTVLLQAIGGNPVISYTLTLDNGNALPSALSFDANTRTLSVNSAAANVFTLLYTVTDDDGDTDTLTFTVTIVADLTPAFSQTIDDISVTANENIGSVVLPEATSGNNGITYTVTLTDGSAIPASLTFDAQTRTLTGTNADAAALSLLYTATDGDGDNAQLSFTVTFIEDLTPAFTASITNIAITENDPIPTVVLPEATSGNPSLSYTLTLNNGDPILTGLSFDATTRTLSGTPDQAGTFTFLYTATDGDGDTATLNFDLAIEGDSTPSFSQQQDNLTVVANEELIVVLQEAENGNPVNSYTVSVQEGTEGDGLPTGLSFDATTRTLNISSATASVHSLTYTVTDNDGDTASIDFTVTIIADTTPAFSQTIDNITITANESLGNIVLPEATSGNGQNSHNLAVNFANPIGLDQVGLNFNATTRTLTGTPTAAGDIPLQYRATDEDGDSIAIDFTITVIADLTPEFDQESYSFTALLDKVSQIDLTAATSGNGLLQYTLSTGLPAGMAFANDTLIIDGTPSEVGNYSVTITATDEDGDTGTASILIEVKIGTPELSTFSDIQDVVGNPISHELPEVTEGTGTAPFSYTLTGETALPAGMTFDPETRIFSGTPTEAVADAPLTYTVTDGAQLTAEIVFDFSAAANTVPVFSVTAGSIEVIANESLNITLPEATDGNYAHSYSISLQDDTGLPAGLSFDPILRQLTGTPTEAGTHTLVYTATDFDNDEVTLTFDIVVTTDLLPEFESVTVITEVIVAQEPVSIQLPSATGGNDPLNYTLISALGAPLPQGLTFDPESLEITGTTTVLGTHPFTMQVTDQDLDIATVNATITVVEQLNPVFDAQETDISPFSTVSVREDAASVSVTLPAVIAGNGETVYNITTNGVADNLPAGIIFNASTRTLEGQPQVFGDFNITVTITDSDNFVDPSDQDALTFTLQILEALKLAEELGTTLLTLNTTVSTQLPDGFSGKPPYTYALTGDLPAGITFDNTTRTLMGVATEEGTFSINYTITDAESFSVTQMFNIVTALVQPEFLSQVNDFSLSLGEATDMTLPEVTTANDSVITYVVTGMPTGISFNPATRQLAGAPAAVGTFDVTYTATDTSNQVTSQDFTITVATNAALTQDVMWRQALYIAGNTVASVQKRFSLVGENRLPYVTIGNFEAANFNIAGDKWLGLWFNSGSGSLDNSVTDDFNWDGSVDVTQVGFDLSGSNFLVGLMSESVTASASFNVENDGFDYTGDYDISGLGLLSIYGGYVTDKFSAWLVTSSGSGDATLNINADGNAITAVSGVDYAMNAVGATYTVSNYVDVSFESITAASLDLTNTSFTPNSTNEGSRTKFAGNFKYNLQQNNPAADLKVVPKVSIAQRSDTGSLSNGSSVEESGLEMTFGLELKYKRLSFEFGLRNFSAENYNESGNWLTFHLVPNQSQGLNLQLTRQEGSNLSNSEQLFENREFEQILAEMNNDQRVTHSSEISYSWNTSIGNLKLFSIAEEVTNLNNAQLDQNAFNTYNFGLNYSSDSEKISLSTELLSADQNADQAIRFSGKLKF